MYILAIPLLFPMPWLLLFPNSRAVLLISILIGSVVGFYGLFVILLKPALFRFTSLLAVTYLLSHATGSLPALLLSLTHTSVSIFDIGGTYFTLPELSGALVITYAVCGILFLFSGLERPAVENLLSEQIFHNQTPILLLWACCALVALTLLTGSTGYSGVQVADSGAISIIGALALVLAPVLPPLFVKLVTEQTNRIHQFLSLGGFISSLLMTASYGRRIFLFSLLLAAIVFLIRRPEILRQAIRTPYRSMGIIAIALAVTYASFFFFFSLRQAYYITEDQDLGRLAPQLLNVIEAGGMELQQEFNENLLLRPFLTLSYLAILYSAHLDESPLWGTEMGLAFLSSIPSTIWPEKLITIPDDIEDAIHPLLGIIPYDGTVTILTASLNDFGLFGAWIYPVLVTFLYAFLCLLARSLLPGFVSVTLCFSLIFKILYFEQGFSAFTFVGLRDDLILVIVLILITRLKLSNRGS